MEATNAIVLRNCFNEVIKNYLNDFISKEIRPDIAKLERYLIDNNCELPNCEVKKLSNMLAIGQSNLVDIIIRTMSHFNSLPVDRQYSLMKMLQDFYFSSVLAEESLDHYIDVTMSADGFNFNGKFFYRDTFRHEKIKNMKYFLPYIEDKFINEECCICSKEFVQSSFIYEMVCRHAFHFKCLDMWLENNGSCPYCRKDIVSKKAKDSNYFIEDKEDGSKLVLIYILTKPYQYELNDNI
ncbi:hypothetical protein HELRODRAFT_164276 [Helobdella robusta]|uniref:RING-type domain-containing protein n=1 Tax=Helobdella robusta TaxID=6412 RepID=T1EV71_HELRO|nr:hypothetical protein HELRODRAFT_164276 [Helobdella robusta]ESN94436.1 hypothetical protein HELRODRAFT_164276 [Helobdella robusta]